MLKENNGSMENNFSVQGIKASEVAFTEASVDYRNKKIEELLVLQKQENKKKLLQSLSEFKFRNKQVFKEDIKGLKSKSLLEINDFIDQAKRSIASYSASKMVFMNTGKVKNLVNDLVGNHKNIIATEESIEKYKIEDRNNKIEELFDLYQSDNKEEILDKLSKFSYLTVVDVNEVKKVVSAQFKNVKEKLGNKSLEEIKEYLDEIMEAIALHSSSRVVFVDGVRGKTKNGGAESDNIQEVDWEDIDGEMDIEDIFSDIKKGEDGQEVEKTEKGGNELEDIFSDVKDFPTDKPVHQLDPVPEKLKPTSYTGHITEEITDEKDKKEKGKKYSWLDRMKIRRIEAVNKKNIEKLRKISRDLEYYLDLNENIEEPLKIGPDGVIQTSYLRKGRSCDVKKIYNYLDKNKNVIKRGDRYYLKAKKCKFKINGVNRQLDWQNYSILFSSHDGGLWVYLYGKDAEKRKVMDVDYVRDFYTHMVDIS